MLKIVEQKTANQRKYPKPAKGRTLDLRISITAFIQQNWWVGGGESVTDEQMGELSLIPLLGII